MALMEEREAQLANSNAVLRDVERALAELRRGAPVLLVAAPETAALVQAAETTNDTGLVELQRLSGREPLLLLTARRGAALGLDLDDSSHRQGVVALTLAGRNAERIVELADPAAWKGGPLRRQTAAEAPDMLAQAAIELAKLARLLPAAVLSPLDRTVVVEPMGWAAEHGIIGVHCDDIGVYRLAAARALVKVAEARVPLKGAENTRVIAFRPDDGGSEHMALVIGEPDPADPVLLRIHSECFTGDLLNSLRCDCGDQLRGAIEAIGAAGAGIVLYLTQEGRGIGLVNKLRAYALQDHGADTAEANETLGFDADERVYLPAAEMLRQLGFQRVRLLTNNPEKVDGLKRLGVEVSERVAHSFPSNSHNDFYLATKARRFGHIL